MKAKTSTKKLWRVINNVIGKNKNKGSIIPYITVEGVRKYNPTTITNDFGKFYSSIGSSLTNKIKAGGKCIDEYMWHCAGHLAPWVHHCRITPVFLQPF